MTGSYCLCVSQKSPTACAQNDCLRHERKYLRRCWCHSPTAHSITVWLRVAHLLLMHHFSSSTSEILIR